MRSSDQNKWPRWRFFSLVASPILLFMATACGGGGDDSAVGGPPPPAYVRYASLSGVQEVPTNASTATGAATFSVNPTTKILTGTVTTTGVAATAAHIHEGERGVSGPVVFPLSGGAGGVWSVPANTVLTDAQYTALQANRYYVNVHSSAFPGGEIRGQIEYQVSFGILSGAQETPAVSTTATGYASLAVNALTGAIDGSVVTAGVAGTGAHIHEAAAGAAGPIIITLVDAGGGRWTVPTGATLTSGQLTSWRNGNLYVNVHSSAYPAGEIRGQLTLRVPLTRTATLSGGQEVPSNPSTATGAGAIGINPITLEVCGGVATSGLTGTNAHIHQAAAGANGPVIIGLTDLGGGIWVVPSGARFTSGQFEGWKDGFLYVNVHSAAYPGGEIRGQLANLTGGDPGGDPGGGY